MISANGNSIIKLIDVRENEIFLKLKNRRRFCVDFGAPPSAVGGKEASKISS